MILIIFISTYTDGTPPESATWFYKYVTEMACDFRFQKDALKGLRFSICGLGNSLYEENFNKVAIELDKCFVNLQATRIAPLYCCDENTIKSKHSSLEGDVEYWQKNLFEKLDYFFSTETLKEKTNCCQEIEETVGCCQSKKTVREKLTNDGCCKSDTFEAELHKENGKKTEEENGESTDEGKSSSSEDEEENYFSDIDEDLDGENGNNDLVKVKKQKNGLIDMEDLRTVITSMKKKKDIKSEPKEMITPLLRKSLEKQGYKLIGTHSGVKLVKPNSNLS